MAVKGLARPQATSEDDIKAVRRYLQQFAQSDMLRARPVEVVFPANTQLVAVAHGLGRQYVGAFCVGVSFAVAPIVLTPEGTSRAGLDISVYAIFLLPELVASAVTANFRVF